MFNSPSSNSKTFKCFKDPQEPHRKTRKFPLERDTKLTNAGAHGVLKETVSARFLRVAAERAGGVGAEEVRSTVMGSQNALINIYNRQEGKQDQIINVV